MKKIIDIILVFFFFAVCAYIAVSVFKIITTSAPDFPSYYYATRDFLTGVNAYKDPTIPNIFLYPAVTSILYLPFLTFPYEISQGIFVILSAFSVPGIVYLSLKLIYKKFSWRHFVLFTSLAFLSFPTKFTLGMGQVNLLAFFLLLLGYYFYQKKLFHRSGVFIALAFLAKPILGLVIVFFFIKKAWRVAGYILITLVGALFISFLLYDWQVEWYYVTSVVPMLLEGNSGRDVYYNQGLLGFFSRFFEDGTLSKNLATGIGAGLFILLIYVIKQKRPDDKTLFALLLTLLLLIHTLSWQHYFVFLIFPFILATKFVQENKNYLLFVPLVISYVLVSMNIKDPSLFASFPKNIVLSHTFFGGVLLLVRLVSQMYHKK